MSGGGVTVSSRLEGDGVLSNVAVVMVVGVGVG